MAALRSHGRHRWIPFPIRLRVARLRAWLAHRRALRRVLVAAAIVLAFGLVASARASVQRVEADWGETIDVVVAGEMIEIGASLDGLVATRSWPASIVPSDAVLSGELPSEPVAAVRQLVPGDVLTRRDVAGLDDRALGEGRRALTVPTGPATPELLAGDRVELIVLTDRFDDEVGVMPVDGHVIEVGDNAVTVSVSQRSVVDLAQAQRENRLVVVRR